jgi:predicted Zn-dependent protease
MATKKRKAATKPARKVAVKRTAARKAPAKQPAARKGLIRGMHGMFYSSQAGELRFFLRDKLGLVSTDVGGGWLIFNAPEADLGVHPSEARRLRRAALPAQVPQVGYCGLPAKYAKSARARLAYDSLPIETMPLARSVAAETA